MKKYNQSGFGIVELLLVVVVVGLVGALGWLVYSRVSKNSNGNSTESTNTEEATGDVVSAPNVNITEWGVGFAAPSSIQDTTVYEYNSASDASGYSWVVLTSPTLESEGLLTSGGPETKDKMGTLVRVPANTKYDDYWGTYENYAEKNGFASKQIGDYFYFYNPTHASKAFYDSNYRQDLQNAIQNSLKQY